ncbi:MAG: hypothetical protein OES09_05860, partial [Gammaproteobacteria bacterium]|nr:hypothetical protein [Gammaproteobacteria bacterium]
MEYKVVDTLAVHGAILFVFFGAGALVLLNVRWWRVALQPQHVIPSFFIIAFAISLLVNTALGIVSSFLGIPFGYVVAALLILHAVLMIRLLRRRAAVAEMFRGAVTRTGIILLIFVGLLFAIMIHNGGLINILADSWWHMSLAKKIEVTNSVFLNRHHLTGLQYVSPRIVYEPGWHVSLAYVLTITGLSAPLVWHALAPWCVALTLCAYFLFAERVTNNVNVAVLAVILMSLLFGGLNSYFRVSPWPGNVSYVLWYFLLFVSFRLLETYSDNRGRSGKSSSELAFLRNAVLSQRELMAMWGLCIVTIGVLHVAELLWYALSVLFYGIVLLGLDIERQKSDTLIVDRAILVRSVLLLMCVTVFLAWAKSNTGYSIVLVFVATVMLVFLHGQVHRLGSRRWAAKVLIWAGFVVGFAYLVDIEHIQSLFYPRTESFGYYAHYIPARKPGYFDDYVRVPFWEHQLRAGLLFSGLIGIAAAVYVFFRKPGRGTGFLFGNAVIPMLLLITPYLFSYLLYFIPEYGGYRISLLIFHPICIAYALYWLSADAGISKLFGRARARDSVSL